MVTSKESNPSESRMSIGQQKCVGDTIHCIIFIPIQAVSNPSTVDMRHRIANAIHARYQARTSNHSELTLFTLLKTVTLLAIDLLEDNPNQLISLQDIEGVIYSVQHKVKRVCYTAIRAKEYSQLNKASSIMGRRQFQKNRKITSQKKKKSLKPQEVTVKKTLED